MFVVISRSDTRDSANNYRKPARPEPSTIPGATPLQRSFGAIDLVFTQEDGVSRASRIFQQGAAKVRFPNVTRGRPPEAVLLNMAGGLTGGDRQEISAALEAGAAATITTQAHERIYRSLGDDTRINARITLGSGSRLEWLPQPVIFFNGARLKRETHVDLSLEATLLAVESIIFGRAASGETVEYGAVSDSWFIRRAGRLIHVERFEVDGAIASTLDKPMVLNGHRAMATLRYVASDARARLDEMRKYLADSPILAAASAWNGMMLARFVAPNGYSLNRELVRVLDAFRGSALPRAWML